MDLENFRNKPDVTKTRMECLDMIRRHSHAAFAYIPSRLLDDELIIAYLHSAPGIRLMDIPRSHRSYEVCRRALINDKGWVKDVPDEHRSEELVSLLLSRDGTELRFLDASNCSYQACWVALMQDPNALDFVPRERFDVGLAIFAVKSSNSSAYMTLPEDLQRDPDVAAAAVARWPKNLSLVPTDVISEEMAALAVEHDARTIKYVPSQLQTQTLCHTALETARKDDVPLVLQSIPHDKRTRPLCDLASQRNLHAIRHIPENLEQIALFRRLFVRDPINIKLAPIHVQAKLGIEWYRDKSRTRAESQAVRETLAAIPHLVHEELDAAGLSDRERSRILKAIGIDSEASA